MWVTYSVVGASASDPPAGAAGQPFPLPPNSVRYRWRRAGRPLFGYGGIYEWNAVIKDGWRLREDWDPDKIHDLSVWLDAWGVNAAAAKPPVEGPERMLVHPMHATDDEI